MNLRLEAVRHVGKGVRPLPERGKVRHGVQFGSRVFHRRLMEQVLPKKVFQNLAMAMDGFEKLDPAHGDAIAEALRNWAVEQGATHYTHWFQPLTGLSAQKHDSFLVLGGEGMAMEQLRGKELLRGEPDASSFPSGGLRSTHEARGYTAWDPASPPFLWEGGDGLTLCIPALYFSWKGDALDHKIPLLRSDRKIQTAVLRLLKLCGVPARKVFSTLGPEQEYFAIDRSLFLQRPDLVLAGRTVFGAPSPKGQELEDHYFTDVKDRVLAFMRRFEDAAVRLGIPVKTRHNEVAPAQHEIAPLFESASLAIDHNLLLMELMRSTAREHGLECLFHEKPFARINGSGKHCNWSLATDTGLNLLDPQENSLVFLTLLIAVIHAVYEHAGFLRASIASAGNEHRLGGSEAPPTIISIYLGASLEALVGRLLTEKDGQEKQRQAIDLGLSHIPHHEPDPSDRNRTSFFAFTGNKFEFRAVGASAHCAFPITVINAIVSDSLELILDEIQGAISSRQNFKAEELWEAAIPVLRRRLKEAKPVLFSGNNYTPEWQKEAQGRGLPNIQSSVEAFDQLLEKKSLRALEEILSEREVHSRREILLEQYVKTQQIEAQLMIDLFRTHILPAALLDQKRRAEGLAAMTSLGIETDQRESLREFSSAVSRASFAIDTLEKIIYQIKDLGWEARAKVFAEIGSLKMAEARQWVDQLEGLVDNALWPLPKYRELLYLT